MLILWYTLSVVFKIKHYNYYRFNHEIVNEKFGGDLTYVGQVFNEHDEAWALYHAANPDRSKGHKDYMMLSHGYVSGRDLEGAKLLAETHGVFCMDCVTYIYSPHQHQPVECGCGNIMVDGGNHYLRSSKDAIPMQYNLITKQFKIMPLKDGNYE